MFGQAIAWCCVLVGAAACAGESTAPNGTAGIGGSGGSGVSVGCCRCPQAHLAASPVLSPGAWRSRREQRPSMDAGPPPAMAGSGSPQLPDAQVPIQSASVPNAGPVLPPITDPGAPGPFTVRRIETIEGLATHGLIIPEELGRGGVKHPILVWINGASAGFSSYRNMLDNVAAQGFFIISDKQSGFESEPEVDGAASRDRLGREPGRDRGQPLLRSDRSDAHRDRRPLARLGLLLRQREDMRIKTSIHMAGGVTGNPEGVDASWLQDLHAPAAFLCGDRDTNGLPRVRNDFAAIPAGVPVFFGVLAGAGHTDEFNQPNGGRWGRIVVAWLRWRLADDETFERSFVGADCEFCKGDWTAMKQAID